MVNAKFVKIIQMLYVMTFQFYHKIHQIQTGEQNLGSCPDLAKMHLLFSCLLLYSTKL